MNQQLFGPIRYLFLVLALLLAVCAALLFWGLGKMKAGSDHFGQIPLNGDPSYYQNWGDHVTREIQDRDIFYHHVGKSIDYAKKADIIILGHSMLLFGLRGEILAQFEKKYGIKIYNLASAGDASGEFLRRVIKRWGLRPKLWIINADDHAANFFNVSLDDFGASNGSSAIRVVKYNRINGYLRVVGRNLRWRIEDLLIAYLPTKITKRLFSAPVLTCWRHVQSGNWYLDQTPVYVKPDNSLIKLARPQDCHTNPEEIQRAQKYLSEIEGHSILMLMPYHNFCPLRVREIAKALKIEAVLPKRVAFSTWDNGGHLDRKGAIAFTQLFLAQLEHTTAFKKLVHDKQSRRNS